LILRDLDLLKSFIKVDVGFTITTANDEVRQLFEHKAPSTKEKISALKKFHSAGIKTYVMIAPLLPEAEGLVEKINGNADYILIDKMNYHYADWSYKKHGLDYAMKNEFFFKEQIKLSKSLEKAGIPYQTLF
jgi:DNA repair photolyase